MRREQTPIRLAKVPFGREPVRSLGDPKLLPGLALAPFRDLLVLASPVIENG
jgi:hypothetical protein